MTKAELEEQLKELCPELDNKKLQLVLALISKVEVEARKEVLESIKSNATRDYDEHGHYDDWQWFCSTCGMLLEEEITLCGCDRVYNDQLDRLNTLKANYKRGDE